MTEAPPMPRFSCMPNEFARSLYSRFVVGDTGTTYEIQCPNCWKRNCVPLPNDRLQRIGWFRRVFYSLRLAYGGWARPVPQQYGAHGQPILYPGSPMEYDPAFAFKLATCEHCGKRFHFNASWTEVAT